MDILLHPIDDPKLSNLYEKAIFEAVELFIVSAYLTEWNPAAKLNKNCDEFTFIVGIDFGITRKAACLNVLKWLPKTMKYAFFAADRISGFHPKIVAWKTEGGSYSLIIGSSNLTQAAFSTNYEANVCSSISEEQYETIKEWVYSIKRDYCSPVSENWLDHYEEAKREKPKNKAKHGESKNSKLPLVVFDLPKGRDIDHTVDKRRQQQKSFNKIKSALADLIKKCAAGQVLNYAFYDRMMGLWSYNRNNRFQGPGFEISGKHANWKSVCTSLDRVLEEGETSSVESLDILVRREIDRLAEAENSTRGSWLSEMLCHFFPNLYPVVNSPVKIWLRDNKYMGPRGASEGAKYIDLAVKLRLAMKGNTVNKAKNLAELDHAIWKWKDNKYPKKG